MRDLPLLLGVRRLLLRERQRVLALELAVVAGIQAQLAAVEVHDGRDDGVEKIAIVRDQQQRARVTLQPLLEPQHGIEVEMVGRLVEQQQVGTRHERLREIEAHAPSPGESRHRIAVAGVRKTQAREQRRGAGARAVATARLVAMVQLRELLAGGSRVGLGVGERAPDRAQLGIAVEHEFDRRRGHRRRFLRHVRDHPGRRQRHLAGVGIKLAAQ